MGYLSRSMERRVSNFVWKMTPPWGTASAPGIDVTAESALALSAVWACTNLLTGAVSRMPVDTLIDRDGTPQPYHEPRWLRRPILSNPNFDRIQHMTQVMASLVIDGNMFVLTPRDDSHDVSELFVLDPSRVEITGTLAAPGYRVQYDRGQVEYGPDEVMHRALLTMPGAQRGVSQLEAARQVVGMGLAAQEYGARFYVNNARPDGYIKLDAGSKTTAGELRDGWDTHHAGYANAHKTGVLVGADWKQLQPTHEQMEFIATRRFQVAEVARVYRIPPWMVGDVDQSTSFGTGIEEQSLFFVTFSLNDYITTLESAYSSLVPNPSSYVRFNRNSLLRGKAADRVRFFKGMWELGAMSPNEIRAKEDLEPVDSGDTYYVPGHYVPAGTPSTSVLVPPAAPADHTHEDDE